MIKKTTTATRSSKRTYNPDARYQTILDAVRTTGLSQYYIRQRLNAEDIPFIRSGRTRYIDVPAFLAQLERERLEA